MTAPRPIPLRPDHGAIARAALASFVRAVIATSQAALDRTVHPLDVVKRAWPNDRDAALVLRAAVSPASLGDEATTVLSTISLALLSALVPMSAGSDLLARAIALDFDRAASISVPGISAPTGGFVGQGAPIPMRALTTSAGLTLSPFKFASMLSMSGEMIRNANAEPLVRQVLIESLGPALDAALLSDAAGSDVAPAGILSGIDALAATAGGGLAAMKTDLAALADAVAPVSGNGGIVFVMRSAQRIALSELPAFPYPTLETNSIAEGVVLAVALAALVSAIEGAPRVDAARDAVVHEETGPAAIIDDVGTVASPVRSMFQTDSISMRCLWPLSWGLRSSSSGAAGAAWISGATW